MFSYPISSSSPAMESTGIQISGKNSQKVIGISAGEAHTLALTAGGSIYSWGRGTLGRLGTGKENDELLPVRVGFDLQLKEKENGEGVGFDLECKEKENGEGDGFRKIHKFVGIAAGAYHSLALEDDGSVWSWGYNIYGQLGLDGENSSVPCLLEGFHELGAPDSLTDEPNSKNKGSLKVCSVKAGGMMSLAIDSLGGLWMWGNCPPMGQIKTEEFSLVSSLTPVPIWDLHGHSVVKVACGNEHVVALVSDGETSNGGDLICYSWGNNNHGQLGLGDNKCRNSPEVVETFSHGSTWIIYEIACGAFHTAILTHKKAHGDTQIATGELEYENRVSVCWTFGLGDNGQLGHGTTKSTSTPEPINELPGNVFLKSIDCGLFHTSIVSDDGDVWSWGMERGLGLCPNASFTGTDSGDALSPQRISSGERDGPKFAGPVQVACGAAHTVFVGHGGFRLWAWGRGRSGVLGRGNEVDSLIPCIVKWPPLGEDFEKDEGLDMVSMEEKSRGTVEIEKESPLLNEELELLRSNLTFMERYASILHFSIFGEPLKKGDFPLTPQNSDMVDVPKEWENMLELADHAKLIRMEAFYQNLLTGVKDKLMKRKIQEMVKEYINALSASSQAPMQLASRFQ